MNLRMEHIQRDFLWEREPGKIGPCDKLETSHSRKIWADEGG